MLPAPGERGDGDNAGAVAVADRDDNDDGDGDEGEDVDVDVDVDTDDDSTGAGTDGLARTARLPTGTRRSGIGGPVCAIPRFTAERRAFDDHSDEASSTAAASLLANSLPGGRCC